jgi:RimJ/RimL family protein N-acetyltransferase
MERFMSAIETAPSMRQIQLVRCWKGLEPTAFPRTLPILNEDGVEIGTMLPIDVERADDPTLIELMTSWRAKHMNSFLTRFRATTTRTADWLNQYLADDSRLLFSLVDHHRRIGQIGLCNITAHDAELDNVLRGEAAVAGFMFYAQVCVVDWGFRQLGLQELTARVLSDNDRALRLNRRVGFERQHTVRLINQEVDGDIRLVPVETGDTDSSGPTLDLLHLDRRTFYDKHDWLISPHD